MSRAAEPDILSWDSRSANEHPAESQLSAKSQKGLLAKLTGFVETYILDFSLASFVEISGCRFAKKEISCGQELQEDKVRLNLTKNPPRSTRS